ncbi:MAG: nucleoside monophosphate kinase [Candidatus Woesearchaeota archaeon]
MIITITGPPGSGKSTVAKILAKKLKFKHYSAGDFRRAIAKKRKISLEELNKEDEKTGETDILVDEWQKKLGEKEDNFVIDGRLPAYFIPHSIKIFLKVNPKVAAQRVFQQRKGSAVEEYKNIDEALKKLKEREMSDKKRYKMLYGIDYNKLNYDLVVDTTKSTPEEISTKVLNFLKKLKI